MKAALNAQSWDAVFNCTYVNEADTSFFNDFIGLYNRHCPLRRVNNSNKLEFNNPWLTNGLKNACRKK